VEVHGGSALSRLRVALAVALCLLVVPAAAPAAFPPDVPPPGSGPEGDPDESVRVNTPDDPEFDRCEPDNPGGPTCSNVFGQQYERFGFAPNASQLTAFYKNPTDPHVQRLQQQNLAANRDAVGGLGQVPGAVADRAWKFTTGDPSVDVAILDTGIRWDNPGLRTKLHLNRGELPKPQGCARHDCDGDGFDVDDYADDPRVDEAAGDDRDDEGNQISDDILDASDLIAAFSDGRDDDGNGYADDISGWDFFDDDNNPFDASSYSSAENHGTGRAEEAGERGNDGEGSIGVCPRCRIVPMRVWDTFVVDMNNNALAVAYAADNDIEVVEVANGGLFNSRFARLAYEYAHRRGVFLTVVSSDLNTADHNIPTVYDESFQVQGTVADVHGLGEDPPQELVDFLAPFNLPLGSNLPVQTWFRNSGTTQYGGHAHIVMPAPTGSQATGQASGAAGLLMSYGLRKGLRLEPNEVKQLLTLTAQDVVAENTANGTSGVADPAQPGWDQHFGYGLPDLGLAMERIEERRIPPQALITGPPWFQPLNVEQQDSVDISGRVSARRASGFTFRLQWAPGIEPAESEFQDIGGEVSRRRAFDGRLGTIDLDEVRDALDSRTVVCTTPPPATATGGSTCDPTAPGRGPDDVDPNEPAFTVRVLVTDSEGNRGEDRKVLFAHRDSTLHDGWPKAVGTGGEASMRMFNLVGGNNLELVLADSSGELSVYSHHGYREELFNHGRPVATKPYPNVHRRAAVFRKLDPPREVLRTPAIGDIDGDLEPEIVASAGEHVYAWEADGKPVKGFPVRLDPELSEPEDRTKDNHVKRGFFASPTLGDLDGDGRLDIVVAALDQHVYAWDGRGRPLDGFPAKLKDDGEDLAGAESINTTAVGDIAGDERPEIAGATNEVGDTSGNPLDVGAGFAGIVINVLAEAIGGTGRIYALDGAGEILSGWPAKPPGALPDALPLAGPGVDPAIGDVNGDGSLDVVANIASGDVRAYEGDGSELVTYTSTQGSGETVDRSKVINLFENPIVADLDDSTPGPEVIKGGVTLNQIVNLGVLVGQNLPYNHVVQAWNGETGESLPAFPQAVEDYQLLSSPAVADVSDADGREIVVGTGLYLLRNLSVTGEEGEGFPKFTGGWIFGVPAIGDLDGDGKLEIATLTREGNVFVWRSDGPACEGNEEWWTSRHDEWSTGAYGTDTRPPGIPDKLRAERDDGDVTLTWRAPGDDFLCGKAARFRVLASRKSIESATDGKQVGDDHDAQAAPGEEETATVDVPDGTREVAVLYQDDAGNWGFLARTRVED
jgi:hypothetical protein